MHSVHTLAAAARGCHPTHCDVLELLDERAQALRKHLTILAAAMQHQDLQLAWLLVVLVLVLVLV
jgi:hypothetical protein